MHGGAGGSGALDGDSRVKGERLGEESLGEEELKSRLQAAAFPFAVAGLGKNQRFLPARVELSVTEFLPAVGEFGVEMRASRLVSEPQAKAFYPVVAELGVGQWPVRAAFPDAAVGSEPHLSVPSEGQVELAWLCHWSRLCGREAAA